MEERNEFLRQTALFNAIGAAFQRAAIYADRCDKASRDEFKRDLEQHLRRIESRYRGTVSSETHLRTISRVAQALSKRYGRILKGGCFRVGNAQKAINIYLKLLWCCGWISEPPHCPIDSFVLAEIGDKTTKWTRMRDIAAYRAAVDAIHAHIRQTGSTLSLSRWELHVWNNRKERGGNAPPA